METVNTLLIPGNEQAATISAIKSSVYGGLLDVLADYDAAIDWLMD